MGESVGYTTHQGKVINGIIYRPQGGEARDTTDHSRLRQSRERHEGFLIGDYIQPPPMLFTRDGHNVFMADMYRGGCAFLICSGPSFKDVNKEALKKPGILTMAVNNAASSFRPNMWTSVDDPSHFIKSIWLDPLITKFVPFCHAEKNIFDNETWKPMPKKVGDCPNIWYFRRNEHFKAPQFLFEDTFNWGNHKSFGGGRSIMLVAMRMLFYLGIRKVFLLGVDFHMDENNKYHFDQDRSKSSQNNNNNTYRLLTQRYAELKPVFDQHGFEVYNCNPTSSLKVFPFMDFNEAIKEATKELPADISKERTCGLYDRMAKEKEEAVVKQKTQKPQDKNTPVIVTPANATEEEKKEIKEKLDEARALLHGAKTHRDLLNTMFGQADVDQIKLVKDIQLAEANVVKQREAFRAVEKQKNLIWYGQHPAPKTK